MMKKPSMKRKSQFKKRWTKKQITKKQISNKKWSNKIWSKKQQFNNPKADYVKKIQEPWFSLIQNNVKVVEGRLNKGDFAKFKKGDVIQWTNDMNGRKRYIFTNIIDIKKYKTFEEMLQIENLHKVLPVPGIGINNIDDGVKVYRQWYTPELEQQFGVIAIHIRVIRPTRL